MTMKRYVTQAGHVLRTSQCRSNRGFDDHADVGRNLIMECCMELLRMLSDEANVLCTTEKKQTIGPDHIIKARQTETDT
jgi:hypothetical protein